MEYIIGFILGILIVNTVILIAIYDLIKGKNK